MSTHSIETFLLAPELSGKASSEHVKAWLKYRAGGGVKDPDSSKECRDFYQLMWGSMLAGIGMELRPCPERFSQNPIKYVQGDWMCSVWNTLKQGLQIQYGTSTWWAKPHIENTFKGNAVTEQTFKALLIHFDEFTEILADSSLQEFVRSAYTLANLIVVPDGFNSARALPTKDYWDKTLRLYFEHFNPTKPLTYKSAYDVGTPFHRLINASLENGDALFLSDWLDETGCVLNLPSNKPASIEEWRGLLIEMTRRIESRRNRMRDRIPKS
ncbi:hypothetical protein [Arcanobacterium pinnipediorum]|uniref:Uncharacterized protein n=1 Tax=Arcanobacterium pinnipediorum TaxID=1503041 RepID=A0ABY5AFU4_9ACTO|nr:hypothetical protein [Arcanobacterium pinnipediorum]USR78808.1 hypothetical protein NG665_05275 [Arcanobacterium pinnipediorum]